MAAVGLPYRQHLGCPRCGASLAETPLRNTMLHVCDTCGGAWLDHVSTTRMVDAHEADAIAVVEKLTRPAERAVDTSVAGIPCPDCGERLTVKRFFPGNVTVDVCREHGIWFDAGELGKMSRAADHHRRSKATRERSRKLRDGMGEPSRDGATTEDSPAARAAGIASGIQWLFGGAVAVLNSGGEEEPDPASSGRDDWGPTARRPNR